MSKVVSFRISDEEMSLLGNPSNAKMRDIVIGKISYHTSNDVLTMFASINHQLTELNQRMGRTDVPAPKVELGGMESLKKYCSNCNQPKGIIGGARDNSGKWVCVDCVKKLTPQEQTL